MVIKPRYEPEQWVIYQDEESYRFGQIVSGTGFDNAVWRYDIKLGNGQVDEGIMENAIMGNYSKQYKWQIESHLDTSGVVE